MEEKRGKLDQKTRTQTTEIHTRQSCRGLAFEMASGLPKSLPPCSRKPHGPPPLSEAVYVVPAISQYSRTASNYCIYKTPLRITEQTSQPSKQLTLITEQRVERHSDWSMNNNL